MTRDWAVWYKRLQARFPHLEDGAMSCARPDRQRFESYLAKTHNLSLTEAREEIDDFIFVEALILEYEDGQESV